MAEPNLNINRYRVIINRTDPWTERWNDVHFNPNGLSHERNSEGMLIGETEFSGLVEGTYSLKLVVKPTNPEVCGENNCRQTRYQDFTIPGVTTQPQATRLLANKDTTSLATASSVPISSTVTPPQTQQFLHSVPGQNEMESATWRVAVIAGPVAVVGLLAATAYCILSWKKRGRAGLTGLNMGDVELDEMKNNRRNKGGHDKSVMTAPTLQDHPELWKRPMQDLSLEEICQPSTSTISTAEGPTPPQHIVCHLHDIPEVIPHQWQGSYPKTPIEQLQTNPRQQFPHSDVYPVDHFHRGVDVGADVGKACRSCGAAGRMQVPPVWKQGCPHAALNCVSGGCMDMGGDHVISEWDDGLDNHCGVLCSQEALYLESQSHLDLFKKLMAYPSRFSVASSQFTEMCDYINSSSISPQPPYDRSTSQPNHRPKQRLEPLFSGRDSNLAPSLKTNLSWRNEVFMRSCPALPEHP
ncbi:uncharacterized protein [Asterias amurensis]|uniref:uncharacterized protein isoform X1 n=1 Tax=Asterias amurensis TaxID=7602 RepID=UPI003AB414CF